MHRTTFFKLPSISSEHSSQLDPTAKAHIDVGNNGIILHSVDLSENDVSYLEQLVKENSPLRILIINKCKLGDKSRSYIMEVIENSCFLSEVEITNCDNFGDTGAGQIAVALRGNKSLKQLKLAGNEISEKGAQQLAEALIYNEFLKKLSLQSNNLGDNGAKYILEALKINKTLKSLLLDTFRIDKKITKDIFDAFKPEQREARKAICYLGRR